MITPEQLSQAGILQDATAQECLLAEAGLDWLKVHTTLQITTVADLPAGAKMFLAQYVELVPDSGVTAESIEGLSQSFRTESLQNLLVQLAQSLLPGYFKAVTFFPKQQQWRYGRR